MTKYEDKEERSTNVELKKKVRELSSENRRLKSELNTLTEAWHKTEIYLKEINGNKTLMEVLKNVKSNQHFEELRCPKCSNPDLKTIGSKSKMIRTCSNKLCSYRETINAEREEIE